MFEWILNSPLTSINYPGNIYMFKIINKNTRQKCEMCSKLAITI